MGFPRVPLELEASRIVSCALDRHEGALRRLGTCNMTHSFVRIAMDDTDGRPSTFRLTLCRSGV